jgi:hypothetical protein
VSGVFPVLAILMQYSGLSSMLRLGSNNVYPFGA